MAQNLKLENTGNLSGRVALVTGGGTGIGLVMARGFAVNGAKVYITGRRVEKLNAAAADAIPGGGCLVALPMDVTSKDSIRNAAKVIEEKDGRLDILVNNAGITGPIAPSITDCSAPALGTSLFETQTFQQWESTFATNTAAAFFVTVAFLELLKKGALAREGETSSVINISSAVAHVQSSLNVFAYGATKAGIEHLTKSMGTEFAMQNIPVRVNAIAPGLFASELTDTPEALAKKALKPNPGALLPVPLLRPGREEEIAMTAIYLASSGGGFTNGVVIKLDGGFSIVNP